MYIDELSREDSSGTNLLAGANKKKSVEQADYGRLSGAEATISMEII